MVLRVLDNMGSTVRARERIFKLVVQMVLVYGSKSWVITDAIMKVLEGIHHRIVRKIIGKMACTEAVGNHSRVHRNPRSI